MQLDFLFAVKIFGLECFCIETSGILFSHCNFFYFLLFNLFPIHFLYQIYYQFFYCQTLLTFVLLPPQIFCAHFNARKISRVYP